MIEGRAVVDSIEKTKVSVEKLGGKLKSNYIFKDIIFIPKGKDYDLNRDFVRVRVYVKSNWNTKNVVLVRKRTEWKSQGKVDNVIIKKEFDTEKEAFTFIKENLPEFEKGFEYSREGWEYELNRHRLFIEDIEKYQPSIEIEAKNEKDLSILFQKIGINFPVKDSIPEIMRRILMSA